MHEKWMQVAWELAHAAMGQTSPNPMVGAVVVKNGYLVGSGAHLSAGTEHAEVHALNMAGEQAKGATLYVTLEPCNHHGQTPPCTEKILDSQIQSVVVGTVDPDPKVAGQGIQRLREAGLEVIVGVEEAKCRELNEAYNHHRLTGLPFVTLKTASTLDGKIATAYGDSRWITSEASRQFVHQLRHVSDAILVGVGTVLADNPRLTTRLSEGGKNPLRVLLDSRLRTPCDAAVTHTQEAPTWIFTTDAAPNEKRKALQDRGVQVISTGPGPQVDLQQVLQELGQCGILSLLVEGGATINASFLTTGLIQKVIAFIAPKLLGGKDSPSIIAGKSPERMKDAWSLQDVTVKSFGPDLCLIGYLN